MRVIHIVRRVLLPLIPLAFVLNGCTRIATIPGAQGAQPARMARPLGTAPGFFFRQPVQGNRMGNFFDELIQANRLLRGDLDESRRRIQDLERIGARPEQPGQPVSPEQPMQPGQPPSQPQPEQSPAQPQPESGSPAAPATPAPEIAQPAPVLFSGGSSNPNLRPDRDLFF